jgi:hypothetical protein
MNTFSFNVISITRPLRVIETRYSVGISQVRVRVLRISSLAPISRKALSSWDYMNVELQRMSHATFS